MLIWRQLEGIEVTVVCKNMSFLSTACFVHKKASIKKNRASRASPKKTKRHKNVFPHQRAERLDMFATLWEDVLRVIQSVQLNLYSEILEDCVHFIEKANEQLAKNENRDGEIPTAILITGVNMPDHDTVFSTLRDLIRRSISPFVISLSSATDADTFKTIIRKIVAALVTVDDEVAVKKMKYTMSNLASQYRDVSSNLRFPISPRKGSPSKRRKRTKATPPIVIIFEDFERILPSVAQDFILNCSEYSAELPIIFVFGVSTSTTIVNKLLSQSSCSKLAMDTFQPKRSSDLLNTVVNEVLLNTNFPFKVSNRLFKFFEDTFLFNDLSVKTFVNGLKDCLMEHFYENPLSALCCESRELDGQISCLDDATLDELRKLRSFRVYVDNLPLKEQKALLLDNNYLKTIVRSKLADLHKYHESFFPILRFLHALCKDLPKNILGKQLRELYSLCLQVDISTCKEFAECVKMLRMMAKDELLDKLKRFLTSSTSNCPNVLTLLKIDLEKIIISLENLKGKTTETSVLHQSQKDVFKMKKGSSAFELLREELIVVIESHVTQYLRNYRSLVFHEIVYVDCFKVAKCELLGNHRESLQTALEDPNHYLTWNYSNSSGVLDADQITPDICVAYKLHTEYSRLINLSDCLQSFNAITCPTDYDATSVNCDNPEIVARFFHSVAELQFLGFVKPGARGKTDQIVRNSW